MNGAGDRIFYARPVTRPLPVGCLRRDVLALIQWDSRLSGTLPPERVWAGAPPTDVRNSMSAIEEIGSSRVDGPLPPRTFHVLPFYDRLHDGSAGWSLTPSWLWVERPGEAPVLGAWLPDDTAATEWDALLDALSTSSDSIPTAAAPPRWVDDGSASHRRAVDRALSAIDAGTFDKVVVGRIARLSPAPAVDPVFAALAGLPRTTRFAVYHGEQALVGASPEVLVACEGRSGRWYTEAVAGTAPRDASAESLLASEKDGREHRFVIDALEHTLSALGLQVERGQTSVRTLRDVHHLVTPLSASPSSTESIPEPLSVVRALHPTPALGGTPRAAALDFLRQEEAEDRGAFGAPVGWTDSNGNAAFVVAIRSAWIDASHSLVRVFAGGGIVRGSSPDAESRETRLKMAAMLRALGVSPEES